MYYQRAFEAIIAGEQPQAALLPLLRTWTMAVGLLPGDSIEGVPWHNALTQLGLLGAAFGGKLSALDAYLDLVDETLEDWGRERGVWTP
jgi:hypothetical protein